MEQPLLGFSKAEEETDTFNILKTSSAFGTTKPLETAPIFLGVWAGGGRQPCYNSCVLQVKVRIQKELYWSASNIRF